MNLQIFNEKTGNFYSTTKPIFTMWKQQGIVLTNHKVFLYGEHQEGKEYYKRIQIYDVSKNKFYLPKNQPQLTAGIFPILLNNGKVLVVNNISEKRMAANKPKIKRHLSYLIYDPLYNSFTPLINNYGDG